MRAKWLAFCLFLVIFIFFLHPIDSDGDFYHHVNIGKRIWLERQLPHTDTQTFTAQGHEFIGYAWASGLLFYLLYSNFGAVAINILVALVAVLTFFLLYKLLQSYHVSLPAIFLTLLLTMPVVATRWPSRPEIFTYPSVLALLLLNRLSEKNWRYVLVIPFIVLLWVNFYGASFPVGMFILGILVVIKVIMKSKKGGRIGYCEPCIFSSADDSMEKKTNFAGKLQDTNNSLSDPREAILLLCLPLSLLSGYGLKSLFFIQYIPGMTSVHGDWASLWQAITLAPPDHLLELQYRLLIFAGFVGIFILAAALSVKNLFKFPFLALLSLGLLAPFIALRQLVLGTFLSAPLLGILLSSLSSKTRKFIYGATFTLAIIMLGISLWINAPGLGEDKNTFPDQIITFLTTHNLQGRIFNTQRLGGYLSYHLYPKILIYADTRDELYLPTIALRDLQETLPSGKSILPIVNKYQAKIVIADLAEGISYQPLFYDNDWVIVYLDGRYAVAIPAYLAKEKKLYLYNAIDPFSSTRAKPLLLAQAQNQYEIILTREPNSFETQLRLSLVFLAQDKFNQALETIQQITIPSSHAGVFYLVARESLLSQAYLGKNDCNSAKDHIHSLQKAVSNKYLLRPKMLIGSPLFKWQTLYFLRCQKDRHKGQEYLQLYLRTQNVSPVEELELKRLFRELEKQL